MFITSRFVLAAGFVLLAVSAAAQRPGLAPADATADGLVAEALQKTPDVTAARAAVEAAQRRIVLTRTLSDPIASINYQNDGRSISLGKAEALFRKSSTTARWRNIRGFSRRVRSATRTTPIRRCAAAAR